MAHKQLSNTLKRKGKELLMILEPQSYSGILHDGVGIHAELTTANKEWDYWIYDGKPVPANVWVITSWGMAEPYHVRRTKLGAIRKIMAIARQWQSEQPQTDSE